MRQLKYIVVGITLFLWFANVMGAETDLLNLSAYIEGTVPTYGENVVVIQDEKTNVKWITKGASDKAGRLKFPVSLSGSSGFELFYGVRSTSYPYLGHVQLILTADEETFKVDLYSSSIYSCSNVAADINALKLSVSNNIAKLYINDVFCQKWVLKPNLVYTQLLVQNILGPDQIYTLKINGTPPPPSSDFESGKQAGIQQCISNPISCGIKVTGSVHATYNPTTGEVHIPFVDVPDTLGNSLTYEVYLLQKPSSFAFDLDMNRITVK